MDRIRRPTWPAVVACLLTAATLAAQKLEVKSNTDPKADFTTIRTYGWLPPRPMITNVAPDATTNATLTDEALRPHIVAAIDRQLARRGLVKVDADQADVQVAVLAAMAAGMNSTALGEYYGYVTGWGSPFLGATPSTSMSVYEKGTIVVDLVDRAQKRGIWRGTVSTRVAQARTLDERVKRINEAMDKVFQRFPVKPRS